MRVLFYTKKIYEPQGQLFTRDRSGLAMYVHDLAASLKDDVELHVITSIPCRGVKIDGIEYEAYTKRDWLCCLTAAGILRGMRNAVKLPGTLREKMKEVYFEVDWRYLERVIERVGPDLVHLHGCTNYTVEQVKLCRQMGVPCVVTLHGLIGINPSVKAPERLKRAERDILRYMTENNLPLSVVSSGVKRRAVEFYGLQNADGIQVILNGTGKAANSSGGKPSDIRAQYGLPEGRDIVCCVGSITKHKNQLGLLRAWAQTDKTTQSSHLLVFVGTDLLSGQLEREIKEQGLEQSVKYLHYVERETLTEIYRISKLNILASLEEGFGLSIIEAMQHGVPTLAYADIDAIEDVFWDGGMLLLKDKSIETLAQGIETALKRDWRRQEIEEHSKRFWLTSIKDQYLNLYKSATTERRGDAMNQ